VLQILVPVVEYPHFVYPRIDHLKRVHFFSFLFLSS
jgi:hypothetical protein